MFQKGTRLKGKLVWCQNSLESSSSMPAVIVYDPWIGSLGQNIHNHWRICPCERPTHRLCIGYGSIVDPPTWLMCCSMIKNLAHHKLLPTAASFCFIIISWNFRRFAVRMSSMLGGIGLREPCNSTRCNNSFLVKLFFWTSSSTTASISFRFCCRIWYAKQWIVTFFT